MQALVQGVYYENVWYFVKRFSNQSILSFSTLIASKRLSIKYYYSGKSFKIHFLDLAYRRKTKCEANLFKDAYNCASTKWKVTKLEKGECQISNCLHKTLLPIFQLKKKKEGSRITYLVSFLDMVSLLSNKGDATNHCCSNRNKCDLLQTISQGQIPWYDQISLCSLVYKLQHHWVHGSRHRDNWEIFAPADRKR